jgi:cytidylate kinase
VNKLEPEQAETLASEPAATKSVRERLVGQIKNFEKGHDIFKSVM